jgi:hypothetical protein
MLLWLLVIALLLYAMGLRESFQDPESPVTRPARNSVWLSKIDSEAPIGGNDDDYIKVLQIFHDKIFVPSPVRLKDTDVEAFLKSPDAQVAGVDPNALRKIIANSFRIEQTATSAAREQKQVRFQPTTALQPTMGRDQVFARTEDPYVPADFRKGELPEGLYEPVEQQDTPRREGIHDDKSTSWSKASFYSTCQPSGFGITSAQECAKNVL